MVPDRESCGSCGQPIAVTAAACPYCSASALVDVRLMARVPDKRLRYQVARAVSGLGVPALPFVTLQESLAAPAATLATRATRAFATRVNAALAPYDLQADLVAAAVPLSLASPRVLGTAALLGVVAAAGFALWNNPPWRPAPLQLLGGAETQTAGAVRSRPARQSDTFIAKDLLRSAVTLGCTRKSGAGFFVAEDLILTNAHVACSPGEKQVVQMYNGQSGPADTIRIDERLDLALVRPVTLRGTPAPLGDAGALRAGDKVFFVGSPMGMGHTFHSGAVSNPSQTILGVSYIQIDARVNPGNSGGPLVDTGGRVIGVVSLKRADAEGIGLALPINYAYGADVAMIAPPAGASTDFEAVRTSAAQEDVAAVAEMASVELLPLLVGARDDPNGRLVVRVVIPSRGYPRPQSFSFHFLNGTQTICPLDGTVSEWRDVPASEFSASMGPKVGEWIKRNGLEAKLYVGEASLPIGNCRGTGRFGSDLTLVLAGALESASRLKIR